MRKFLNIFFIILLVLLSGNKTFSDGINFDGEGFYSSISENLGSLSSKMYSIELQNNGGTLEKISQKSGTKCINRDLTEGEIKKIVVEEDVSSLNKFINNECRDEEGRIEQDKFIKILNATSEVYVESQNNALSKSEKTMGISNVGIYTDGIEGNGPFDIIIDFEKIDEIIFEAEEDDKFEAEEEVKLGDKVKDLLNKLAKKSGESSEEEGSNNSNSGRGSGNSENNGNNSNSGSSGRSGHKTLCDLSGRCDNYTEVQKILCEVNGNCNGEETKGFISTKNNFVCTINTSGLDPETGKTITDTLSNISGGNNGKNNGTSENGSNGGNSGTGGSSGSSGSTGGGGGNNNGGNKQDVPIPKQDYKKVNDNKVFPCDNFFCIDIEFKFNDHSILGGWKGDDPSIEFLVKRSNGHLKKFVNSSLAQGKMTINNFELGLKDLNLSEMFHLGFNISYEPVPMLYLNKDLETGEDKETNKDEGEFKLESQLEKYYKARGMDYKQRNDLSAFNQVEYKNQAGFSASGSTPRLMGEKLEQLRKNYNEELQELDSLRHTIEDKVRTNINSDLEIQMKEIEAFNKAMNNYVINLDAILNEILKIPVDGSMT